MMKFNDFSKKDFLKFGGVFSIVLLISVLATAGLGYMSLDSRLFPFISKVVVTGAFIYLAKDTKFFRLVLILCLLVTFFWIFSGAGLRYGRLNSLVMAAVMGTDQLELGEFIKTIPLIYPMLAIFFAILVGVLLIKLSNKKLVFSWGRCAILLLLLGFNSFGAFGIRFFEQYKSFVREKEVMVRAVNAEADWQVIAAKPRYKNYVIVFGESVSKDYMSLYGYRLPTSPFLDSAPITYASNYIAPAPYTYPSLGRTLTLSEENSSNPANHAVTLANAAGFETYWLSNQGYLGETDTRVAALASKSKHTFFLKKGSYNSINIDDIELFTHIEAALEESAEGSKVIFLHIMGSHPMTCERLFDFPNQFNEGRGENFDCYLASIQKTDAFLKDLVALLNEQKESYSLMYFSDHGMSVEPEEKILAGATDLGVHHGHRTQQNYAVPFLWMNTGQTQRREIKNFMTGFDFIHLYASWLGISEGRIKNQCIMEECIFVDDPYIYDGDRMLKFSELRSEPVY